MRQITVPSHDVTAFGSTGVRLLACERGDGLTIQHAQYEPGGQLGRHPAASWQSSSRVIPRRKQHLRPHRWRCVPPPSAG